jgi:alpha/beta superfamily hydrolase
MPFYHYGAQQQLPLSYEFVEDLHQYQEEQLTRPLPTLILHGCQDQVIPITASRHYATQRNWVQLTELNSDHTLGNALEQIWQSVRRFCQI